MSREYRHNFEDFGYAQIDTAFFHQWNWETGEYNPLIANTWDSGVGVINYRGWGDANGWNKPYFHSDQIDALNNLNSMVPLFSL